MGIETEYGISATGARTGEDDLHPMQLSNHVVKAYGSGGPGERRRRTPGRLGLRDRVAAAGHPRPTRSPGRARTPTS